MQPRNAILALALVLTAPAAWGATWYVDGSRPDDTGNGLAWSSAKKTVSAAVRAATQGDTVLIDGGTAGREYRESLTIAKGITLQGASEAGRNGTVSLRGEKYINNTSGTVLFKNVRCTTPDGGFPLYLYNGSATRFEDVLFENLKGTDKYTRIYGGTHSFVRCRFRDVYQTTYHDSRLFWTLTNPSTVTFEYCTFEMAGTIDCSLPGNVWQFRNCNFVAPTVATGTYAVTVADGTATTDFTNCVFLGCSPVLSGASTVGLTAHNCWWHRRVGNGQTFDSFNKAVLTACQANQAPYLVRLPNNGIGSLAVRLDDLGNTSPARTAAATLNPEVKVTLYTGGHGAITTAGDRITPAFVDAWRWLVENGNEVGGHGSSHSDLGDLGAMIVSATGTNPTLSVATNNDPAVQGDSVNWTGSLTVTINGAARTFDLTASPYNTLGGLVTMLNGLALGNGTITATGKFTGGAHHSTSLSSLCLADVANQPISAAFTAQLEEAAFVRWEVLENLLDVEAYINTGMDRNGQHDLSASLTEPPPATPHVVRTYATAYGRGRLAVKTALMSVPSILGASTADGVSGSTPLYRYGDEDFDLYCFPYVQVDSDERTFAMAATAAVNPVLLQPLWHALPTYQGSVANLKALLTQFGVAGRTVSDVLSMVRTSGDWAVNGATAHFTGNAATYLWRGDFTPQATSPLVDAGLDLGLTADVTGAAVPWGIKPDIGAFEFGWTSTQPAVNDGFAARWTVLGASGSAVGANATATRNPAEPLVVGNPGGRSVWFRWTAPQTAQASVDTHGSTFDTLLGVYTGADVSALALVAENDNDGSPKGTSGVTFPAMAGTEYQITVDGVNGASGTIVLHWGLTASSPADLSVSVSASPNPLEAGGTEAYVITVANAGPSAAANTRVTNVLPAGSTYLSSTGGCTSTGGTVTCSLGTLGAGAVTTAQINAALPGPGTAIDTVSVASDAYDPSSADNSATVSTMVSALPPGPGDTPSDGDVPFLPPWGIAAAGCCLVAVARGRRWRS